MADNEIDYREEDALKDGGLAHGEAHGSAPVSKPLGYRVVKRAFDLVMSLVVLVAAVLLLPVTLILLVAVAVQTGGSPIYTQERVGRDGRPLRIYKLRTMVADSDDVEKHLNAEQLEQWQRERKVDDDPRIVPLGRVLRKTSLDELPQFLNVLLGQMSVIGPRPITTDELAWFGEDAALMLSVPPGITGWWQVSSRNNATFESGVRQELELTYVANASISFDARIFLMTFASMAKKTGR